MKQIPTKTKIHLFICCHRRDGNKICCARRHSEYLVEELKEWITQKKSKDFIKVSKSSCLGLCEKGITACLYPHNKWFIGISPSDSKKIKPYLEKILLKKISTNKSFRFKEN